MKIKNIKVDNFRLLKNFSIDVEKDLSLIIGKNNTGKTSLLAVLDKFLNKKSFSFDDLNIELQAEIKKSTKSTLKAGDFNDFKITLRLYIELDANDRLENISKLILNLDHSDKFLILSFEYCLDYENYNKLINDFNKYSEKIKDKDILYFLSKNYKHYFKTKKKALESENEDNFIEIEDNDINKIVNLQIIEARRDVSNTENKTLSKLSCKYYDSKKNINITDITELQKQIIKTDDYLSENYEVLFEPVINSLQKFSSVKNPSVLEVKSTLQEINLLKENTSVKYNQDGHNLPEDYNGLGYMNLFAIIFEIHIKLDLFKKLNAPKEKPADINLLLIEEPEAHTHPQMQYIFIKNIKEMLNLEAKDEINLQTIISTHSSHIASQSDFNDIKYFFRENKNSVIVKNLSELENKYGTEAEQKNNFKFLKKYLTLNNSELFFADKVIFIEGDTERILLPAMMKKLDNEEKETSGYSPLLSQNISIIEVGNYSHVFDEFLKFLDIKTLIITDIDSVKNTEACPVLEGTGTSNASIKYFIKCKTFEDLKNLTVDKKMFNNNTLMISYQISENSYQARSFEDAFIAINLDFIKTYKSKFESLKCRDKLEETPSDYYGIAQNCINKKSIFATDILFYCKEDYSDWKIPKYIKEGLKWLAM